MRKIISILVAVGLVLSVAVMATPASADVSSLTVGVVEPCAGNTAEYTIEFDITADLHSGTHSITVAFADGTTVPATYQDGDITVETVDVFGSEVTVDGTTVTFLVPDDIIAIGANPVTVVFTTGADIVNPATAGTYELCVNTSRAPDSTPVCVDYDISPAISDYKFTVDFSSTYPGIALDFVPPFKACGQDDSDQYHPLGPEHYFTTYYNTTTFVYYTMFDFIIETDGLPGCDVPCEEAELYMIPTVIPAGETVTLEFNGVWYTLTAADITDPPTEITLVDPVTMVEDMTDPYAAMLHFSSPGEYEICFYLECPTALPCGEQGTEVIIERCIPFTVHQWKDAFNVPLYRKWTLISLPLVPFETDIDAILAAYPLAADIMAIWHYDGCVPDWFGYPDLGLSTMEDGKAYWFYIDYDFEDKPAGDYHGCLWVWGHEEPMPPASPSAYEVCIGWNMVGFRSMLPEWDSDYLWNFYAGWPDELYGMVYTWDADNQEWDWGYPDNMTMYPGFGYWIPFSVNGHIYP